MTAFIVRRNDLTVRDLGTDMILYDQATETFHILNGSARSIWLLLEKDSTSADIEEQFVGLYPDQPRARLEEDLARTLKEFRSRGLLKNSA